MRIFPALICCSSVVVGSLFFTGGESIAQSSTATKLPAMADLKEDWLADFVDAQRKAKQQGKGILVYFSGSDWCRPCMQLKKKVFDSTVFQAYAHQKLVLLQVNFPARKKNQLTKEQTRHNERLAEKFNAEGAFPHIVLLDEDGQFISSLSGYNQQAATQYVQELTVLIAQN